MTINKISKNTVKIHINKNEFSKYGIDYSDINISNIKKLLLSISDNISEVLETDITSSKLFVEVFSQSSKCLIFVSASDCSNSNKKTENHSGRIICQFENFDLLEDFCRLLKINYGNYIHNSSLYCRKNKFRIIIELSSEYENIRSFASDCCCIIPADELNLAVTDEYYRKISSRNAMEEILSGI